MGTERLNFGVCEARIGAGGMDGQTDGREMETGENRLVWNHRSSAPPGPLFK